MSCPENISTDIIEGVEYYELPRIPKKKIRLLNNTLIGRKHTYRMLTFCATGNILTGYLGKCIFKDGRRCTWGNDWEKCCLTWIWSHLSLCRTDSYKIISRPHTELCDMRWNHKASEILSDSTGFRIPWDLVIRPTTKRERSDPLSFNHFTSCNHI